MNTDIGIAQQAAAMASPKFLKPDSSDSSGAAKKQTENSAVTAKSNNGAAAVVELKKQGEHADKKDVKLDSFERFSNRSLKLEIDHEAGMVIAKIVDKDTGEVIKQVPPEELVKVAEALNNEQGGEKGGLFVNKEA